ncbi:MAG: ribonuclease HII [Bdellovibrionales bacterium]
MFSSIDYLNLSPQPIVGVDEAGRGCLAGPVFAGAVILKFPQKFQDSKSLSWQQRKKLSLDIKNHHIFGIGFASIEEIESLNIHQASLLAMKRAVENLKIQSGHLIIDGKFTLKGFSNFQQTAFVKGDQRALPIMAAGILAKTERDQLLISYSNQYPEYGFEKHKGYATKKHKQAIQKYGPCSLHRKSFSGVKEFI